MLRSTSQPVSLQAKVRSSSRRARSQAGRVRERAQRLPIRVDRAAIAYKGWIWSGLGDSGRWTYVLSVRSVCARRKAQMQGIGSGV